MNKHAMDPLISSPDSNEYLSAISHLVGAILSLAALIVLIVFTAFTHKWLHLISFTIYGTSLLLSFIFSSLLHFFLLFNKYRRTLGILDHCAIYILIAGTYTPFCLVVLGGTVGWTLFGIIWGLVIFNITIKATFFTKMPVWLSNLTYISMGWLIVFCIYPIYQNLGLNAIILMLLAGLSYTIGAISFALQKPNPLPPFFGNHEIWHLAVMMGNFLFFLVMLIYVLPYSAA